MSSHLFGSKGPQNPHMLVGSGLPKEVADLRKDLEETFTDLENGGLVRSDEFTNPITAAANHVKTSFATSVTASVLAAADLTNPTIPSGAREITVSRSAAVGAYSLSPIVIEGLAYGKKRTLTFTPGTADGGDTLTSAEREGLDSITKVSVPGQASGAGAFTIGVTAKLGLRGGVKARAGLTAPLREVVDGAIVTTATFDGRLYIPATAPNGVHDYAVTYEVNPAV
jgi:hypothetical protein